MEINKPINENINASELLVIDEAGKKIGVLKLEEAIKKAKAKKKDLILINEGKNGQLSVAKIDDYKRYLYMQKIKNKEAKKSIGSNKVKEMKIKPQISDYDINWITKKMSDWIENGHQVKLKIKAMGRVGTKQELINETYQKFVVGLASVAKIQVPLKKLSPVLYEAIFVRGKK